MGFEYLSWIYPLQLFLLPFLGYPSGYVDLDSIVSASFYASYFGFFFIFLVVDFFC